MAEANVIVLNDQKDEEIIELEISDGDAANNTENQVSYKDIPLEDGKEYHLFLSHANEELEDVRPILEILESEPYNTQCCIDRRDFTFGETIVDNIKHALNKSVATVFFLSPKFLASDYCNHEKQMAYTMFIEGDSRIIPVVLKSCKIPDELRTLLYIDEATPFDVADKIYKALIMDPKAFKQGLPLSSIQAGILRMNGSRYVILRKEQIHEEDNMLLKFQKDNFKRRGIIVKSDDDMEMVKMIAILKSMPINYMAPYKSTAITRYFFIASFLLAIILCNPGMIIYFLFYSQVLFDLRTGLEQNKWLEFLQILTVVSTMLSAVIALGTLFVIVCVVVRKLLIKKTRDYIALLNALSLEKLRCAFNLQVSVGTAPCYIVVKYDVTDCKEHIEGVWRDEFENHNFEDDWKKIMASEIFKTYFNELCLNKLKHTEEERHAVFNDVQCFCQYFEAKGGIMMKNNLTKCNMLSRLKKRLQLPATRNLQHVELKSCASSVEYTEELIT